MERNNFSNFGRGSPKKHFCESSLKSAIGLGGEVILRFSIFGSSGHFVQWSVTNFSNFGRGSPRGHFCEIILKSGHWSRRRCRLQKLLRDGRMEGRQTNIDHNRTP